MAWVLTRGQQTFRGELDVVFPGRDKSSSGSVGDLQHQGGRSGHNPDRTGNAEHKDGDTKDEVRAVDEDADLVPGSAVDWMLLVIQHILGIARAGGYVPFRYIIYRPRGSKVTYIWARTSGWVSRVYTGANPHDKHAHFSGDYTQKADEWTGSLNLAAVRPGTQEGEAMIPCRKGDEGEGVRFWQYVLNRVNAAGLTIDGDYGPKMEAAVNAYRAKHGGPGTGPSPMISGWMGYHALSLLAAGYAGKSGERGPQGPTGPAGKDGSALGGNLTVTGGSLRVVVAQEG